jgi:type IV secretory pathway VirB10-like protein
MSKEVPDRSADSLSGVSERYAGHPPPPPPQPPPAPTLRSVVTAARTSLAAPAPLVGTRSRGRTPDMAARSGSAPAASRRESRSALPDIAAACRQLSPF